MGKSVGNPDPETREGVIKYTLDYRTGPAPESEILAELNAWRQILFQLGLVGQDPQRYDGLGFGNVSRRVGSFAGAAHQRRFVISGTQTGGLARLGPEHYVQVTECRAEENLIRAVGPVKPSSEAMTHGALYALDNHLRTVLHAHSPEIWQAAMLLGLPVTDHRVVYGTPQMAAEMQRLYQDPQVRTGGIIVMGGHPDGVVAFGAGLATAGSILVKTLAAALQVIKK